MTNDNQRIDSVELRELPTELKEQLDLSGMGPHSFPNFLKILSNSPPLLEAYLHFDKSLEKGQLTQCLREKIALLVSELNSSEYDVAAHTQKASSIKLSKKEIERCRQADTESTRDASVLNFTQNVILKKGILTESEFNEIRQYDNSDALVIEVVAVIAQVHFENLVNNLSNTKLDYPSIEEISHK